MPVNAYKSFRVTTPNFTDRFMRHLDSGGITSVVDTASSRTDRLDATFLITRGLADPSCYSLQANNDPGHYLRHKNGVVKLDERATDLYPGIFDQDATWCAVPGLAGSDVSLQSKNFPDQYLRHMNGQLVLTDASANAWAFKQDATWKVVTALTDEQPVAYPVLGRSTGKGSLPAKVSKVEYLGEISTSHSIPRDVGFSGVLNGQIVWTFADTLLPNGAFCASNSAALGSYADPLKVTDKNLRSNGCPQEWVPFFGPQLADGVSRWANWITNVVEHAPNQGLVWFASLDRNSPGCTGVDPCPLGAGVAKVTANENGAVVEPPSRTVWNGFEPLWGDAGAAYDPTDGYVYVLGRAPTHQRDVYLARARPADADKAEGYQYFDNATKGWTSTRFTSDGRMGTVAVSEKQAIFTYNSVDQTTPFWSNHYNAWMMVYGDHWSKSNIHVMTAPKLEGPWTNHASVNIDTCPTNDCSSDQQWHYAITGHPEFDPSGKSVLVTWSTWPANRIYAKRITWE